MMQRCSTEQRANVDLRSRLTNFKMLVSQLMSAVLRQPVLLLLNVKSSAQSIPGTGQQFVVEAAKSSNILGF